MARPAKEQNKTARMNLAILPDLKSSLEKLAAIDELSLNALVEKILSDYVDGRKGEIAEFVAALKKIRGKAAKKSKKIAQSDSVKDADDNE